MRLAAHQPDFLPYTGFFYKMDKVDVFDLAIFDQFNRRGYTHRVKMLDEWLTVPTVKVPLETPIAHIQMTKEAAPKIMAEVERRYRDAPFWTERSTDILDLIGGVAYGSRWLWQMNLSLILGIRNMLGIDTPLAIATALPKGGQAGIERLCELYQADVYLSGQGATEYLENWESPADLEWSKHVPWSGDSILTTLFHKEDPVNWVLNEAEFDVAEDGQVRRLVR